MRTKNWVIGTRGNDNLQAYVNDGTFGRDYARPIIADRTDYTVFARGGDDTIQSGGGNNVIFAGAGNDVINGGPGNDMLWGGAGADIFQFNILFASPGSGTVSGGAGYGNRDKIMDFKQGSDIIDVSGWQDQQSGQELSVTWRQEGGSTIVLLERLAFPQNEFSDDVFYRSEIELTGRPALTEADFIFG
jgi:Ca2+-binding RTX toxin-like protein